MEKWEVLQSTIISINESISGLLKSTTMSVFTYSRTSICQDVAGLVNKVAVFVILDGGCSWALLSVTDFGINHHHHHHTKSIQNPQASLWPRVERRRKKKKKKAQVVHSIADPSWSKICQIVNLSIYVTLRWKIVNCQ